MALIAEGYSCKLGATRMTPLEWHRDSKEENFHSIGVLSESQNGGKQVWNLDLNDICNFYGLFVGSS